METDGVEDGMGLDRDGIHWEWDEVGWEGLEQVQDGLELAWDGWAGLEQGSRLDHSWDPRASPSLPGCSMEAPLDDPDWSRAIGRIRDLRLCGRSIAHPYPGGASRPLPTGSLARHRKLLWKSP